MKNQFIVAGIVLPISFSALATNGAYPTANGAYASGMGGVSVALAQDATVASDNPAGMSAISNTADLYGFILHTESNSTFLSEENKLTSKKTLPAFGGGFNYQLTPKMTLGVSATGMAIASDYKKSALPIPGFNVAKSMMVTVNTLPTITYKITDDLAVGASMILGVQNFRAKGVIVADSQGDPLELESHGNAWAIGYGGGVGVLWKALPQLNLGASYYTETKFSKLSGYKDDLLTESSGRLSSPPRYSLGFSWSPTDSLIIAGDYVHLSWDKADGYNNPNSFNWGGQDIYRVGVQYQINNLWAIRTGYSHGESQLDMNNTLANVWAPGINTEAITAGFTYTINKKQALSGAFEYNIPNTVKGQGISSGTNIHSIFNVLTLGYTYKF